jgi:hypothetical protein
MNDPGEVEISLSYARHLGPRLRQGGVTLRFGPSAEYCFESQVEWPKGADYGSAVRKAIEEALLRRVGALPNVRVVLAGIVWHDVDSSLEGFRRAAAAAAAAAFDV